MLFTFVFISLLCIANYALTPEGMVLREWDFIHEGKVKKVSLPHVIAVSKKTKAIYEREITGPVNGYLVISQPNGYSMSVFIDERKVYSIGTEDLAANIWTRTYMIPVQLKNGRHHISIVFYGMYDIGLPFIPYISKNPFVKVEVANILFDKFYLLVGGIALSLSLVLFALSSSLISKNGKKTYLCFSLATLFVALNMLDNIHRDFAGDLQFYLFDRRVNYALAYLSILFLYLGMKRKYSKSDSVLKKITIFVMMTIIILILFYPNFYTARAIHKVSLFLVMIVLFASMAQCISAGERKCVPPFLFLIATFIHDVISYVYGLSEPLFIAYGTTVIEFYIVGILIRDYVLTIKESYRLFILDSLTGAYNRGMLKEIETTENDSVIFADLDDLKLINDRYGHDKGDEMLKKFVEITKKNIKGQDYVVRYGGDEFVIILKDCTRENADKIIRKIRAEFENELKSSFSYGISSCTEGLQKAIIEADRLMYDMKFNKKEKRGYSGEGSYN